MSKVDNGEKKYNFTFFGTDDFSIKVLEELKKDGYIPSLIITAPDRPAGRGQKMQEPPVKIWATNLNIEVKQPEKLDANFIEELKAQKWDFFVTASYGRIIPKEVLEISNKGAFNVHPSLLPLYRGASPVESAILGDQKETGVTIMLMDEKMDHGPILNQEFVYFEKWPTKIEVENRLAEIGGKLLSETIEPFLSGEIEEQEQDRGMATFTKKIIRETGEIKWSEIEKAIKEPSSDLARQIFLKIQALNPWPGVFFFIEKDGRSMRIKIKSAQWNTKSDNTEEDFGKLEITSVLPEGKKQMTFEDFKRGYLK